MLKADSSTLKSESDVQSRNTPPIRPSVGALSRISLTTRTICEIDAEGRTFLSSVTRYVDSSARPKRPRSASARKTSGTSESRAK
jgi:hypothetical protein